MYSVYSRTTGLTGSAGSAGSALFRMRNIDKTPDTHRSADTAGERVVHVVAENYKTRVNPPSLSAAWPLPRVASVRG